MSAAGKTIGANNAAEVLIGAAVVAVAVIFIVFVYMRTGTGSLSGYEVNAKLAKADGLGIGTDVRLAGIKVGTISDLTLDPKTYLVVVHMNIRDDIKIPADSSVMVGSPLLGSAYLSISPGGDDKMIAPGGFFENAQGSVDVNGLIQRFMSSPSSPQGGQPAPKPQAPAQPAQQAPAPSP